MNIVGLIPAAGRGKRLRPLTDKTPKPLIEICGKPLIMYAINHLCSIGVKEIIIALHYKKNKIKKFLESIKLNVPIKYCYPDELLGLAYTIYSARELISSTFVVHLADNIFTENCRYAIEEHIRKNADATLVVEKGDPENRYETILMKNSKILDIVEKAKFSYGYRGTGIYIFEPTIFKYCEGLRESERGEIELQDAIKNMIKNGKNVFGVPLKGKRVEITTEEDIKRAERTLGCG